MPADKSIRVTALQRLCVHDGPGVRTTVFLKGCFLQCPWCCNPETIRYDHDLIFDKGLCKHESVSALCENCVIIGGEHPKGACPFRAFESTYTDYDVDELLTLLMRDKKLYEADGGVTFSGGEPLLQATALLPLLQKLKKRGIHITLETSLYSPLQNIQSLLPYIDYWIVDLKFQYGYVPNPDAERKKIDIEKNLFLLQTAVASEFIHYRMVVMREIMNRMKSIIHKLKLCRVDSIELLGYHFLGENKYYELGRSFRKFTCLGKEELKNMCMQFETEGVKATFLTI